jgi:hypothetical protein
LRGIIHVYDNIILTNIGQFATNRTQRSRASCSNSPNNQLVEGDARANVQQSICKRGTHDANIS